jgi:uncharacterized protein
MIAIEIPKDQLRDFCRKWKITEFSLFGSVVRDDFEPGSDIDVMIEFPPDAPWSLLEMVDMNEELEAIFGRRVDLLTRYGVENSRNYLRREAILSSAVQLDVA